MGQVVLGHRLLKYIIFVQRKSFYLLHSFKQTRVEIYHLKLSSLETLLSPPHRPLEGFKQELKSIFLSVRQYLALSFCSCYRGYLNNCTALSERSLVEKRLPRNEFCTHRPVPNSSGQTPLSYVKCRQMLGTKLSLD